MNMTDTIENDIYYRVGYKLPKTTDYGIYHLNLSRPEYINKHFMRTPQDYMKEARLAYTI